MTTLEELNDACRTRVAAITPKQTCGFDIMLREFVPAAYNPYLVAIWLAWQRGETSDKHIHYAFFVGTSDAVEYSRGCTFAIPAEAQVMSSETVLEVLDKVKSTRDYMLNFLANKYGPETTY